MRRIALRLVLLLGSLLVLTSAGRAKTNKEWASMKEKDLDKLLEQWEDDEEREEYAYKPPKQGGRWNPGHSIKMVLLAIQTLLDNPNNADPAQASAHAVYNRSRSEYAAKVRQQMQLLKAPPD